MIRKIPTATMSKEEWTALRSTTIGGSDAAAILGLNPYKSTADEYPRVCALLCCADQNPDLLEAAVDKGAWFP